MRAKSFRLMVSLTDYNWIWWASTTSMRAAAGYVPRQSRSDFQQTIMSKRPCLASASIRWNPGRFLDPPTSWWWFTMVRPKFLSQAPCRHPARTMKSCPLRLGSGVKRGRRLPPSVRPSPVRAVWSWPRFPPPDLQKFKTKETRLLPGAGLRVVRVHRVTCEAQVEPRLGVLLPPLGQLVPATLPVAGLPSKDLLPLTSDPAASPTRFTGILILPAGPRFAMGGQSTLGVPPVPVNHQPVPDCQYGPNHSYQIGVLPSQWLSWDLRPECLSFS